MTRTSLLLRYIIQIKRLKRFQTIYAYDRTEYRYAVSFHFDFGLL